MSEDQKLHFYKRNEVQEAKKEKDKSKKKEVLPVFSLTASPAMLKSIMGRYELHDDYVWDSIQ